MDHEKTVRSVGWKDVVSIDYDVDRHCDFVNTLASKLRKILSRILQKRMTWR